MIEGTYLHHKQFCVVVHLCGAVAACFNFNTVLHCRSILHWVHVQNVSDHLCFECKNGVLLYALVVVEEVSFEHFCDLVSFVSSTVLRGQTFFLVYSFSKAHSIDFL